MEPVDSDLLEQLKSKSEDTETVLDEALADTKEAEIFIKAFSSQIKFFGRTLSEWEEKLSVLLPPAKQITPDVVRELHVTIANNIQIASHYYSMSAFSSTSLKNGLTVKKSELTASILADYSVRNLRAPSQAQVDKMVGILIQKLSNISAVSAMLKHYWREKLEMLDRMEKSLNSIAISQAVEMRHLES